MRKCVFDDRGGRESPIQSVANNGSPSQLAPLQETEGSSRNKEYVHSLIDFTKGLEVNCKCENIIGST